MVATTTIIYYFPSHKVVGTLDGAKEALSEDESLVFLWEKFTTAPLVKAGLFRRVGECPTPWPCFSIAAKRTLLERTTRDGRESLLSAVLDSVRDTCERFKDNEEDSVSRIAETYELAREDVQVWFEGVEWACKEQVSGSMLQDVVNTLQELERFGQDTAAPAVKDLCACEVVA
jgi:sulfonate transport system substrate-binding protein